MMGHLGARVSALLDGQLPPAEAEEAWRHVYGCNTCRDLVEREGWVKSRLAGLAQDPGCDAPAPHTLKGSLLNLTPGEAFLAADCARPSRRLGLGAAVGGGAVGAALLGVVALGLAPGSGSSDIRPPSTRIGEVVPSPVGSAPAHERRRALTPSSPAGISQVVNHRLR